ncbi:hypothetical protein ACR78Z_11020 [Sphingobacterium thalpophilum]|uniref:hypothetical protein n=1 Tax=Sphingobacterium thalpophilum TaxID=259 RepID=UPI003DA6C3A6
MILGGAMIIGFSAFKGAEAYAGKSLAPVTVYFHGDPTISTEVEDLSQWNTSPNGKSCNNRNELACAVQVDPTDLNSSGTSFDSSKIAIEATSTSSGYIPSLESGYTPMQFDPINRN